MSITTSLRRNNASLRRQLRGGCRGGKFFCKFNLTQNPVKVTMASELNEWKYYWEDQFEIVMEKGAAFFFRGYTLLASSEVLFRKVARTRKKFFAKLKGPLIRDVNWKKTQEHALLMGFLPAYLLLAFAIENFIKNYLCEIDKSLRVRSKSIPKKLRSHDLLKLIAGCGIDLDKKEELLLDYLTTHLAWRGRYDVPLNSEQYAQFSITDFKDVYVHTSFDENGKFSPEVKSLLKKLGVRYRGV